MGTWDNKNSRLHDALLPWIFQTWMNVTKMTNQRNIASKENTWNKDRVWRGIIIAGKDCHGEILTKLTSFRSAVPTGIIWFKTRLGLGHVRRVTYIAVVYFINSAGIFGYLLFVLMTIFVPRAGWQDNTELLMQFWQRDCSGDCVTPARGKN